MQASNIIAKLKSGIIKDFSLNIIASAIFTIGTQLIAYPYLSRIMTSAEYGLLLTMMGIVNVVGVSLGNPLNNTRIIEQPEYDREKINGDYNPIFLVCILVNIISVASITIVLQGMNLSVIGYIIISALISFRAYYSASYRIVINYKMYLYSSLCGLAGYLFGIVVTHFTNMWVFTFIFGELFSCVYIYFTASIVHDKFRITKLFKKSFKKYLYFMSAAILSNLMIYMDRFFIYPVLGADQVAIYIVASFLGKTAGIVMAPISGVLLTYYAKEDQLSLSQFYKRMGLFTAISIVIFLMILLIGIPITRILYPTLVESVIPIFAIANLATTIFILGNTIQPTLLKFCNAKWQPIIQGIYLVLYLFIGFICMKNNGLIGFCYAVLFVNIIKIIMMLYVVTFSLRYQENDYVKK